MPRAVAPRKPVTCLAVGQKTLSNPYTFGYIYLPAFLAISIASFIAAPYGVRCSHSLPEAYLKKIFAVISLALSIKMLISFVHF